MRFVLAACLILCGVTLASLAFAAEMVVIESTAPELAPGQTIDGAEPLKIPAGAMVVLIAEDGQHVRLKGPYSGVPDARSTSGGSSLLGSLSRLLTGPSKGSASLAVMRTPKPKDLPEPWLINVERTGDHCVKQSAAKVLWRQRASRFETLTLKALPEGSKASVPWHRGESRTAWPDELPLAHEAQYLARLSGSMAARKLTMHMAPKDLPTAAHYAAWMADRGCSAQAKAMLSSLAREQ